MNIMEILDQVITLFGRKGVPGSDNSKYKGPDWKAPSMLEE